jgi:hypothetical protein
MVLSLILAQNIIILFSWYADLIRIILTFVMIEPNLQIS